MFTLGTVFVRNPEGRFSWFRCVFKNPWIIVKNLLTPIVIIIGDLGINNWVTKAIDIISNEGLKALQNPVFISNDQKLMIGLVIQIIFLTFMIIISVFKPKKGKRLSI